MPIAPVGTYVSSNGTGLTTQAVTTATEGDMVALHALILNGTNTIDSIAGGTADGDGWERAGNFSQGGTGIEIWYATVGSSPGASTITVTWTNSPASTFIGYGAQPFSNGTGAGTTWALDGTGSGQSNGSATTCAYPPKTPAGQDRLYLGYGYGDQFALVAGAAPYTYRIDSIDNCFLFNPDVDALTSPATGATTAQTSHSLGVLMTATGGEPPPSGTPRALFRGAARGRASLF